MNNRYRCNSPLNPVNTVRPSRSTGRFPKFNGSSRYEPQGSTGGDSLNNYANSPALVPSGPGKSGSPVRPASQGHPSSAKLPRAEPAPGIQGQPFTRQRNPTPTPSSIPTDLGRGLALYDIDFPLLVACEFQFVVGGRLPTSQQGHSTEFDTEFPQPVQGPVPNPDVAGCAVPVDSDPVEQPVEALEHSEWDPLKGLSDWQKFESNHRTTDWDNLQYAGP
ncbi:hypothetical protein C8J56DRAFT_1166544 [Mycena floridula]|nr:hypothetical protein C8J56DRAFT_1166544 [Mycena floridula]